MGEEKRDQFWVSENDIPLNARQPNQGGVAWDRLKLLLTDVFGVNVPGHVRIVRLENGVWVDHSTAELVLVEA